MNKLLVISILSCLALTVHAQTFTIQQNSTGNPAIPIRGQSFRPSMQGSGTGSTGSNDKVVLKSFQVVYHMDAVSEAAKLYIYSSFPIDAAGLSDGTSGTVVAESTSKTEDFPYTVYHFNDVLLDKNTTYFALFREDVYLESASGAAPGPYNGGELVRNSSGALEMLTTADLRMKATFEQFVAPSISVSFDNSPFFSTPFGIGIPATMLNITSTKTVTIKNGGPGNLTLGTVTVNTPEFWISKQPGSIVSANSSTTFEMSYSSTVDGTLSTDVVIPSNDPNNSLFVIDLSVNFDYPLPRPENLYALSSGAESINLYWDDKSSEDEFLIERSAGNDADFSELARVPAQSQKYIDRTAVPGETYFYRVHAIKSNGERSGYSNIAQGNAGPSRTGDWEAKTAPPVGIPVSQGKRAGATGFSVNGKGYIALGANVSSYPKDLWQYDPSKDSWTRVADFPGEGRRLATSFVIDGKAYVGLGQQITETGDTLMKDFYVYDPVTDSWTAIAEFPGEARYNSAAIVVGGKAYVGLGIGQSYQGLGDFFEYDPVANSWRKISDFPGTGAADGFTINGKGYVYLTDKKLYEFNPAGMGSWTQRASMLYNNAFSSNFVINGKGYVIGGFDVRTNQEYDPSTDTWTLREAYPTAIRQMTAFAIGGKGYAGLGDGRNGFPIDFWEYNPISPKVNVFTAEAQRTRIALHWEDNADNESGYILERGEFIAPDRHPESFEQLAVLAPGQLSYVDETVIINVNYKYRLRTILPEGESQNAVAGAILHYPLNVTATRVNESNFNVEWTAVPGVSQYIVETATSETGDLSGLSFNPAQQTGWPSAVLSLSTEQYYYLRVKGYVSPKYTDYSDTLVICRLNSPADLILKESKITGALVLKWTDLSSMEDGFIIERRNIEGDPFETIGTVGSNITSYEDLSVEKETDYQYRVTAVREAFRSLPTDVAEIKTSLLVTNVENQFEEVARLYPNPVTDRLSVDISRQDWAGSVVSIVAADGRATNVVSTLSADSQSLDVSHLPKGVYILSITGKNGVRKFKFIKG